MRSTADAAGYVLESNENDNASYAYIEITGSSTNVMERGFDQSLWDKPKVLAKNVLRPAPKALRRNGRKGRPGHGKLPARG